VEVPLRLPLPFCSGAFNLQSPCHKPIRVILCALCAFSRHPLFSHQVPFRVFRVFAVHLLPLIPFAVHSLKAAVYMAKSRVGRLLKREVKKLVNRYAGIDLCRF
jgi:hypothetical protein